MAKTIDLDPITRIEGHLAVKLDLSTGSDDTQHVTAAYCLGEMFRGFEQILRGRHPMDAHQITQRICGVCPVSHGTASILAQEMAFGVEPPTGGRILRNMVLAANYIQSHIIHFYHLSALDFVDIAAVLEYDGNDRVLKDLKGWVKSQISSKTMFPAAPFLPRYEGNYIDDVALNAVAVKHYVQALEMRQLAHQCAALFAGKMPHPTALLPGGVTTKLTATNLAQFTANLQKLQAFIDDCYISDVLAVAQRFPEYFDMGRGCGNFLAYGVFPESSGNTNHLLPGGTLIDGVYKPVDPSHISEEVGFSMFSSPSKLHPSRGETIPDPNKDQAYTWLKAPRYSGKPMEVGPLARILIGYHQGNHRIKAAVDDLLTKLNATPEVLVSVLGRHAARAIECKIIADRCGEWLRELEPGMKTYTPFELPEQGDGYGLTEAPRGALGHWISIQNKKIKNYQCIVPTTWNCSPRDDSGTPGPVEQSLVGVGVVDEHNPLEAARVIRSFDPCLACAVH